MMTALCSIAKLKKHKQTKDKDPYKDFQMPGRQSSRERSLCVFSLTASEEDAEDPVLALVQCKEVQHQLLSPPMVRANAKTSAVVMCYAS